jgi:Ca2+-binding EF-hand superfamily protein
VLNSTSRHLTSAPQDFELTIDINRMLQEMDKDSNGTVDYGEFKMLLSAA